MIDNSLKVIDMKIFKMLICSIILFFGSSFHLFANELIDREVDGHRAKIIKVTPNSGYKVVVSASNTGTTLQSLIDKVGGVSGVNGAFFCPKDYPVCGWTSFSNTLRIINGSEKPYSKYYPDTGINGLFWFDANNLPTLLKQSIWAGDSTTNFNTGALSKMQTGLANFPIYLYQGENKLSLYTKWDIDAKMRAKSLKNFICSKKDGTVLLGWIENVTVFDMPNLLLKFDCYNAINLDTGGSTAMIYNGKNVKWPGRNIMDAFVVVKIEQTKTTPIETIPTLSQTKAKAYIEQLNIQSQGDKTKREKLKQALKMRLQLLLSNLQDASKKEIYQEVLKSL